MKAGFWLSQLTKSIRPKQKRTSKSLSPLREQTRPNIKRAQGNMLLSAGPSEPRSGVTPEEASAAPAAPAGLKRAVAPFSRTPPGRSNSAYGDTTDYRGRVLTWSRPGSSVSPSLCPPWRRSISPPSAPASTRSRPVNTWATRRCCDAFKDWRRNDTPPPISQKQTHLQGSILKKNPSMCL